MPGERYEDLCPNIGLKSPKESSFWMAVSDVTPSSQTVAIRPPEYWPGLVYMALVQQADTCVLADTFQYSRQSFQNRARIRNPQGWQWISVPLKGGQHGTAIDRVRLRSHLRWQRPHWRALTYNYRTSPFFVHFERELQSVLDQEWHHLGALTCKTVQVLADFLGLGTKILRASALAGRPETVSDILEAVTPSTLLIPEAVAEIDAGHAEKVRILHVAPSTYRQNFDGFEAGMSALDLVFNYGPEASRMLAQWTCTARNSVKKAPSVAP